MRRRDARRGEKRLSSGTPIRRKIPRPDPLSKGKVCTLNRANEVFGSFAKLVRSCHQRLGFGAQLLGPGDKSFRGLPDSRIVPAGSVSLHENAIDFFYDCAGAVKESAKIRQLTNCRFWLAVAGSLDFGVSKKPTKGRSPPVLRPGRGVKSSAEGRTEGPQISRFSLRSGGSRRSRRARVKLDRSRRPGEAAVWEIWWDS